MTDCHTTTTRLDGYLDGELGAAEQREVEAHLATCARCRAEADALRSILADARALPRSVPPEHELWTGIAARLTTPIGGTRATPTRGLGGLASRAPAWGRLAAAIALILFGAALATLWQRRAGPSGFAAEQARYTAASTDLAQRLAADPGDLPPATRAVVERNLAIIDQAIREAETALAADPGNTPLEQMLVARYEQRLALLRHATSAGRTES
jgi:anti-sigma factor RsiW